MSANLKRSALAVSVALLAMSGGSVDIVRLADLDGHWTVGAMAQESGGHDSGSTEGGHTGGSGGPGGSGGSGGHDSGASGGHDGGPGGSGGHGGGPGASAGHGGGPGASGGHGGGHDPGSEGGGEEAKGHGTRMQHQGHASGRHGAASAHQAGGDRFGGGSGLRGNDQVPEGIGRYGAGAGYASDNLRTATRFRFRYWGGWTLPDDPTDPNATDLTDTTYLTSTSDAIPGPGGGPSLNVRDVLDSSSRCEGVAPKMSATEQLGSTNLRRLTAARGVVDPELAASGKIPAPYLMANLQEELLKPAPDTLLAGTYLGLVATVPVTAESVQQVGFYLCTPVNSARAAPISVAAETQRRELLLASQDNK